MWNGGGRCGLGVARKCQLQRRHQRDSATPRSSSVQTYTRSCWIEKCAAGFGTVIRVCCYDTANERLAPYTAAFHNVARNGGGDRALELSAYRQVSHHKSGGSHATVVLSCHRCLTPAAEPDAALRHGLRGRCEGLDSGRGERGGCGCRASDGAGEAPSTIGVACSLRWRSIFLTKDFKVGT